MTGAGGDEENTLLKMLLIWDHRFAMCCPGARIHLWVKGVSTYASSLVILDGTARNLRAPEGSTVTAAHCPQQTSPGMSSGPPPLDHDGASHYVIHCPVVLEEEERDEGREQESDGEVFAQGSYGRPEERKTREEERRRC